GSKILEPISRGTHPMVATRLEASRTRYGSAAEHSEEHGGEKESRAVNSEGDRIAHCHHENSGEGLTAPVTDVVNRPEDAVAGAIALPTAEVRHVGRGGGGGDGHPEPVPGAGQDEKREGDRPGDRREAGAADHESDHDLAEASPSIREPAEEGLGDDWDGE